MEILRNSIGYPIGKIATRGNMQRIYDMNSKYLGYYDVRQNKTYNSLGALIGTGNLLASLLII